jgi:tetratricopeptide (TPR) repeat protein
MELTIGEGILSGYRVFDSARYLQTTAPISPGSSGGGLWDEQGRLLGITSFYEEFAQNVNFAAPVEWIDQIRMRSKKQQDSSRPVAWLEEFSKLSSARDWMRLKELSRHWCAQEPDNAWAWYARGVAADNLQERRDTAVQAFKRALQLNERFGEAWEQLALQYGEMDSLQQELALHRRAAECMPRSASVWFNLGSCAANLERNEEAIRAYRRSIAEGGEEPKVLSRLALSLSRTGRSREALALLDRAVAMDSNEIDARRIRGLVLQGEGRPDSAMASWREVLDREPRDWMAWHNLGVRQYQRGKWQQAILSFEEAVRLDPTDDDAWYGLASAHQARGHVDKAVQVLQKAVSSGEPSAFLWRTLGEMSLADDRSQMAWNACRQAASQAPDDPGAWACRSWAAFRLGRIPQARSDAMRAQRLSPGQEDAHRLLVLLDAMAKPDK